MACEYRRPDGAGWLARRVQTGRRVKLSWPMVRGWYEPCTFEQWVLFEEEPSQHTSGTMRRRPRDGRSGLPSTTLDHLSATELPPTSPLRPWVSVDVFDGVDHHAELEEARFGGFERMFYGAMGTSMARGTNYLKLPPLFCENDAR